MIPAIIFFLWVSGSGKSTVMKQIIDHELLTYVPSTSSRAMRVHDGEKQGKPYWFVSEEEFLASIEKGEFLEWAVNHKTAYYGTKYETILAPLSEGKFPIKEIDVQGLEKIKESGKIEGKYVTIFLNIDDITMTQRILQRQPDIDPENLQKRLNSADMERSMGERLCDHIIDASSSVAEVVDAVMDVIENKIIQVK